MIDSTYLKEQHKNDTLRNDAKSNSSFSQLSSRLSLLSPNTCYSLSLSLYLSHSSFVPLRKVQALRLVHQVNDKSLIVFSYFGLLILFYFTLVFFFLLNQKRQKNQITETRGRANEKGQDVNLLLPEQNQSDSIKKSSPIIRAGSARRSVIISAASQRTAADLSNWPPAALQPSRYFLISLPRLAKVPPPSPSSLVATLSLSFRPTSQRHLAASFKNPQNAEKRRT